jgi:hypothetical protein
MAKRRRLSGASSQSSLENEVPKKKHIERETSDSESQDEQETSTKRPKQKSRNQPKREDFEQVKRSRTRKVETPTRQQGTLDDLWKDQKENSKKTSRQSAKRN